ncbi:MAG: hypothetical protein FWF15_09570, partial [Oscillospiraceae bacterium]|nr:hypothetical protein [Oscillospiraceae bacterium]
MKIAIIGAGGKITTATILELLNNDKSTPFWFSLYGRTARKIENTLSLAERFNAGNAKFTQESTLEDALAGADLVLYCASYGLKPFEGYEAYGVQQGGYLMGIAERMVSVCPNAWLLVVTNPPDIPLLSVHIRFGLDRVIGLCNASVFTRKVLAAHMGYDVMPMDFGVNHELWYYDVRHGDTSVYGEVRASLLNNYNPETLDTPFHREFPEWREGFKRNVAILRETGYLHGPVGGCRRFRDLPDTQMSALMKRPNDQDFVDLLNPSLTNEQILRGTRRCAAEFPIYIADIVHSILLNEGRTQSALVLKDSVMIQLTCKFYADQIELPVFEIPEFIEAALASRIKQNRLLARALAEQDVR